MFDVHTFPVGSYQCNCTVLTCKQTREAVVIDPGGDAPKIGAILTKGGFRVKWILHTHAHLDHIAATATIKEQHGGEICLNKNDMFLYQGAGLQAAMMGFPPIETLPVDHFIQDEETFPFGILATNAIHTPGHTPGSSSFLFQAGNQQLLFSGDTLFHRSIGRTDLPGGDPALIAKSIRNRLFTLDLDTCVIPGHGPATTIGEELRDNPFVGKRA